MTLMDDGFPSVRPVSSHTWTTRGGTSGQEHQVGVAEWRGERSVR